VEHGRREFWVLPDMELDYWISGFLDISTSTVTSGAFGGVFDGRLSRGGDQGLVEGPRPSAGELDLVKIDC